MGAALLVGDATRLNGPLLWRQICRYAHLTATQDSFTGITEDAEELKAQ